MKKLEWLAKLRGYRSQQKIADLVGISRSHYSNIENGLRPTTVIIAKKIAHAMGFNWTIFFDNISHEMNHTIRRKAEQADCARRNRKRSPRIQKQDAA